MWTSRTKPALVIVCSSPSQVAELKRLRSWWSSESRTWIAPDTPVVRSLLTGEDWAPATPRGVGDIATLVRRIGDSRQLVVADTGAAGARAVAVARMRRVPSMVIESAAEPSASRSRSVARQLADRVLVSWPDSDRTTKFVHVGGVS